MALTEVWRRGASGEWTRTSVSEADKEFKHTVSVNSSMFRCYKCFQYVVFVKGTDRVSSHFKHSRGDTNKDCEDRSVNLNGSYTQFLPFSELPLKLELIGNRASVFVGLPPIGRDEIQALIKNNCVLRVSSGRALPSTFRIDYSRFIPNTTNWFEVQLSQPLNVSVKITPDISVPRLWKIHAPTIPSEGALFDARNGKRVCEKGDVQVGKEYYLLRSRLRGLYLRGNDITSQSYPQEGNWVVYRIKALRLSDYASEFFFDELHMRLTQLPSDIDILWPPVVQSMDVINTRSNRLWIYVHGEQDMQTYPVSGNSVLSTQRISPTQKIYEVKNNGSLQMICAERYSQTLQCVYIRPSATPAIQKIKPIEIYDGNNQSVNETELTKVPPEKMLRFTSQVDGSVSVYDEDGFCYRKPLQAGQETRITELRKGLTIVVRQACSIVTKLILRPEVKGENSFNNIQAWKGRMIPFPSRFSAILQFIPINSDLYKRVIAALRQGKIQEDGMYYLCRLEEAMNHE